MNADPHPPQADMRSQSTASTTSQWRYIPIYEMVMGFAFALIGLISASALIAGLLSGSRPSISDLTLTIAAAFVGICMAVLIVRSVSQSWLHIRVQEDIEIYRWLLHTTHRVPLTDAQAVRLNMYISPIYGIRAEASLILSDKGRSIDLPILRHLFPTARFRDDALNLAQTLQIPLLIPDRHLIPLGFQTSFDALRIENFNLAPKSAEKKLQQQAALDSLIEKLLLSPVSWQATNDDEFPYRLDFDGQTFEIRVNDWPDYETVYSLVIAKQCVRDLPALPDYWERPQPFDFSS